jgi:hypothetical protein
VTTTNTSSVVFRDEIQELLAPLIAAAQQPAGVQLLLQSVGRTDELGSHPGLRAEIERLATLAQGLAGFEADSLGSWEGLARALDLANDLLTAIHGLERLVSDPSLAEQGRDLGLDLVQHLLALHLRARHAPLFRAASLLTLITPAELAAPLPIVLSGPKIVKFAHYTDQFHPERIANLLRQPLPTLAAEYFPNGLASAADAHEAGRRLFPVLALLAETLGLPSFSDLIRAIPEPNSPPPPDGVDLDHFGDTEPGEEEEPVILPLSEPEDLTSYFGTFLPRFVFVLPGQQDADGVPSPARFAVSALVSSAGHPGGARGLIVTPLGQVGWSEVRGGWRLSLESSGQVPAVVLGPGGVGRAAADSPLAEATARLLIERAVDAGTPAFALGAANGTRLEIGVLRFTTDLRVAADDSEVVMAADAQSGALVLAPGDGDSFLSAVLPSSGLRIDFDLGLELSSTHGLRLRGAAGLDATLPIAQSIGGVTIQAVHLSLRTSELGLTAEVSVNVGASLGPVNAAIEQVGITAHVTFPESSGNLGVANLNLGFKPPNGVGLSIDAAGVTGGGFVRFDPEKGQYDGIVQLNIEGGISVKGMGLIATRLPNNAKGFSLLIMIAAEDFKPIPLGLGFKLTGIGGLLAVNRTFNEDVLRAGLQNRTLDSVLFPKDPIRNAPQILSSLNKVFPSANGHHLFGPVAKIEWGTPTLITADLALVLELGARRRLLILAQIVAVLPKPENDLIHLQMDAIGVLDFDQGTAALDATLYGSRLLKKFVLTGDTAMRLKWEGAPNFALAIGGLHPAFNPPPNFPKLERIAINLTAGDNPRFRCEAYFALTANTVQFGACAELYAEAHGFSIHGETGFDVLIQLAPFQFLADFYAQVQLKHGSTNLFKVRVEGALAGPRPLHIKAKATFEILWCDVSIRFDKTLVEGEKPPLPEPVDVLAQLKEALGHPGNWIGQLPAGQRQMVTLRARSGTATDVLLHPLGTLTVKQNIVPLEMDISRFGAAPPAGTRRFSISSVSLAGQSQTVQPVRDFFAPAQFLEMSDDDKLSRPSFEQMAAGVTIGSDAFAFSGQTEDWLEVDAIEFETIIVDKAHNETRSSAPEEPYALSLALLGTQAQFGAAGASELRHTGRAKYRMTGGKYQVAKEGWSIVDTRDLTVQPPPGIEQRKPMSYSEAEQALRRLKQADPVKATGLKILRFQSEVQAIE